MSAKKDIDDFKFAVFFWSQQSQRYEVELGLEEKQIDARIENLARAGIRGTKAFVNATY